MDENAAMEIHDSSLERIEFKNDDDDLLAVFSAYVHRSAGRPGVDEGSVWSQTIRITVHGGRMNGIVNLIPVDLYDGFLQVGVEKFNNCIPMPIHRDGATRIELIGANGTKITFEGNGVESSFVGEAQYVEEFPGVKG